MHPSGDSGINVEAVPGPAQFKLRTPQALSHVLGSEVSGSLGRCPPGLAEVPRAPWAPRAARAPRACAPITSHR
eukprot:11626319-Alexandrium_andersonii.AAC.1